MSNTPLPECHFFGEFFAEGNIFHLKPKRSLIRIFVLFSFQVDYACEGFSRVINNDKSEVSVYSSCVKKA